VLESDLLIIHEKVSNTTVSVIIAIRLTLYSLLGLIVLRLMISQYSVSKSDIKKVAIPYGVFSAFFLCIPGLAFNFGPHTTGGIIMLLIHIASVFVFVKYYFGKH
jgi:hypothetical protein